MFISRLWNPYEAFPVEPPGPLLLVPPGRHGGTHVQRSEHSAACIQVRVKKVSPNLVHGWPAFLHSLKKGTTYRLGQFASSTPLSLTSFIAITLAAILGLHV